ncbi:PQQ-binding-like beta-propeller repeat protein [Mycoplasmatota bacterium]|nr:PQQ-binding-like beta-propeller repeat protein [Mycoplasmatota bacterium]
MKKKPFIFLIVFAIMLALTGCFKNVELPSLNSLEYDSTRTLASVELPEGWEWEDSTIVPTVDVTTYKAIFTKEDGTKKVYNLSLSISKTTPTYQKPTNIITDYVDAKTLNDIDIPDSWTWKNADSVLLEGVNDYLVIFTPEDTINYNTVEVSIQVTAYPGISAPDLNNITYDPNITLADINLPEGWAWETVSTVPTVNIGEYNAIFTYNDNSTVKISVPLVVEKAIPTIISNPVVSSEELVYGSSLPQITAGEASVEGTFAWVNSAYTMEIGENECEWTFTPNDTDNYNIVTDTLVLSADKATPNINTNPTASNEGLLYGSALPQLNAGEASVEGTFTWVNSTYTMEIGENECEWIFTPTDTENYNTISGIIELNIDARAKFEINEDEAIIRVFDSENTLVSAVDGYYLLDGMNEYTYQVTKTGFVAQTGTIDVNGGVIEITLVAPVGNQPTSVTSDWYNFRNSNANMGITDALTPIEGELLWAKKVATGWTDAPSIQIIVDDSLIVMAGTSIIKYNLETGDEIARGTMVAATNWGYTPATYAEGMIFVPLSNGRIQAFNAKTLESLWIYHDALVGQSLSPITYSDGYIYTGFWNSETKDANFVCISITDEDTTSTNEEKLSSWTHTQAGGFYWAGSVVIGDAVIVGTDDGTSSYDSDSAKLYAFNKITGEIISALDITGDQRSSIAYDEENNKIYFTSKNAYLYSATVDSTTGEISNLESVEVLSGWQSTSTPVVYNGRVYIGLGQGFSSGKLAVIDTENLELIYTADMSAYPQNSLLLSTAYLGEDDTLYIYSTYNGYPGGIYAITDKPGQTEANGYDLFIPDSAQQQYCITSIIASKDGVLYYKNDSGYVLAVTQVNYDTLKTDAKTELENYVTLNDYRDEQQLEITNLIADGKLAIDNAISSSEIANALSDAKAIIDLVKTDAELTQEELENAPTIVSNLEEGKTYTNSKLTFDIWAKDKAGNKINSSDVVIICNGENVLMNWDDVEKTSYSLEFVEYENIITITATANGYSKTVTYTVYYEKGPTTVTMAVEAHTIGCGYLVEPMVITLDDNYLSAMSEHFFGSIDIDRMEEGLNGSYLLAYVLEVENGYTYQSSGSLDSGFYLSQIEGFTHQDNTPEVLRQKIEEEGGSIDTPSDNNTLGEFEYTYMSGWMYSVNDVFPNVGFADYNPQDGDVIRVQFTLFGYGRDIGVGGFWGENFFEDVNKAELTALLAQINTLGLPQEQAYTDAYVAIQEIGTTQAALDVAYQNLYEAYKDDIQ